MNVFVLAILFYLLYRFIGGFVIPLFRATQNMRRQFHDVNSNPPSGGNTGNQSDGGSNASANAGSSAPGSGSKVGEYIDFEEVK
jgi:hypothetical protein